MPNLPAVEEHFELVIDHKGKEHRFDARLMSTGYTHQFVVTIDDRELIIEKDEDRNYRVMEANPTNNNKDIDTELLQAIVLKIKSLH